MKKLFPFLLSFLLICSAYSKTTTSQYFKFIDPVPDAKYVSPEATIIITPENFLDRKSLQNNQAIEITGSVSGSCSYDVIQSSDNKTYIVKPLKPFHFGETVVVNFTKKIKTTTGISIKPLSYHFTISKDRVRIDKRKSVLSELNDREISSLPYGYYNYDLIQSFPQPILNYFGNPSPGRIFLADFTLSPQYSNNLIILNNDATVFYSSQMSSRCFDFNMQPNGNLTYVDEAPDKYYEVNKYLDVVDSFYCGNGYNTDVHELRLLANRHALLMSYDSQHVDMSQLVPGGDPDCVVSGLIIQEIDESKNVVFQWRSWDHFQITDAWHENFLAHSIDAVHGNAIELDNDGNLLISSRHIDEITKINRTTGEIIWRFGGKNNQFTFAGDTLKFTYQHAIRRLKNGNVILYDNGNFHSPPFSRAVEYTLDEQNKIATVAWQYRNPLNTFGGAMGFAQRLDNGNTLIGWGFTWPSLTEVRSDGTKELEISFPVPVVSYRAFKYIYKENEIKPLTVPQSAFLSQNYPNPFNPKTTITFGLPRINGNKGAVNVLLKVYDILGREIATLINEPLEPYTYNVSFDANGLPSGVYFYSLRVSGGDANYNETRKMLLVK